MSSRVTYEKKLCMSELHITHAVYESEHHCDGGLGADSSRIVLCVRGAADIHGDEININVHKGELFYIPEGARYDIIWSGTPEIEYYIFHIFSKKYDSENTDRYEMQLIGGINSEYAHRIFSEVLELMETGSRGSKLKAISIYYSFFAEVFPLLQTQAPKRRHPAVLAALNWLEAHFAEDTSAKELAGIACVSESRLYHLFRDEMGTTPVAYRNDLRIRHAAAALRSGEDSIDRISLACGFNSAAYFREIFKRSTGFSPMEYRIMSK